MDWLSIVDTGVKVGLGAAITAIATLMSSRANNRQAADTAARAARSQLLRDIAVGIQRSYTGMLKCSHALDTLRTGTGTPQGVRHAIDDLAASVDGIAASHAWADLLDDLPLKSSISEYFTALQRLYEALIDHGEGISPESFNDLLDQVARARQPAYNALASAYGSIYPRPLPAKAQSLS
jgi:hypothetical protein